MYERKFGLQRRPFLARVSQSDVFVGPQTAQTMASLRKALQVQDAIVAVTGQAGSGKSTLVGKAAEAIAETHTAVRIGRMSLRGTDILEFLLEELGVARLPNGPIRQFTALRERLRQLETDGRHVIVVVEDARRLGADTLAELEALTAADAGESAGAAIVVMGDENLREFLNDTQLVRLVQRIRLRHAILPLSEAELRGYFMHCFRRAGGDFEQAFDRQAVAVIRSLSNGIPRMANTIAEASMSAAAANGTIPVSAEFVAEVALREFGLESPAALSQALESTPEVEETTPPPTSPETEPESHAESTDDPVVEIPELIQDTLPDLEVLAPDIETASDRVDPAPEPTPEPEPAPELELDPAPEPEPVPESEPQPAAADVPEWDRDPTMAELRPDLDALEQAMALVREESDDGKMPDPEDMPVLQPEPEPQETKEEEIPEITLDNAISERVENNLIDEPDSVSRPTTDTESAPTDRVETPELRIPQKDTRKADAELERIAAELARAKTLEDVDDKLAETLFGEELSLAAAQVVARVQAEQSANDEQSGDADTGTTQLARAVGSSITEDGGYDDAGAEIDLGSVTGSHAGLDLSASQRLNTVRALGASQAVPPAGPAASSAPAAVQPTPDAEPPASIEDQINTSMTQTLKALDVKPPTLSFTAAGNDEDEQEETKRGFFRRFRRS